MTETTESFLLAENPGPKRLAAVVVGFRAGVGGAVVLILLLNVEGVVPMGRVCASSGPIPNNPILTQSST